VRSSLGPNPGEPPQNPHIDDFNPPTPVRDERNTVTDNREIIGRDSVISNKSPPIFSKSIDMADYFDGDDNDEDLINHDHHGKPEIEVYLYRLICVHVYVYLSVYTHNMCGFISILFLW
jgi:hypothetical protein